MTDLVQAETPAQFLKLWIALQYPEASYEQLVRKCGLGSKGHLHDLTSGRRNVSHKAFLSLCQGLKIKTTYRKLFQLLCENPIGLDPIALESARLRIRSEPTKLLSSKVPTVSGWDYVYSSLGTTKDGATLTEIERRTCFNSAKCLKILAHLIELGVVKHHENHYFARASRNVYESLSIEAKDYLASSFQEIKNKIPEFYEKTELSLYRGFVFAIQDSKFPQLRERLKELLSEFVEESEFPNGNELVKLVVGMERHS